MLPDVSVDTDALAATLAQLDIHYLRTALAAEPLSMEPAQLIAALAQHPSPRVREALISLFLRYPSLAACVPDLDARLPAGAGVTLRHLYTAAVYLQRLWQGKLAMYLGPLPALPDYFGQPEWNLPPPAADYGEAGLRALAERFRAESGDNWLSTYQTAISLFLTQLRLAAHE